MQITLDQQPTEMPATEGSTLGQVIQHIRLNSQEKGRSVFGIRADGMTLSAEEIEQQWDKPLASDAKLDFETDSNGSVADQALMQAGEILDETSELGGRIAESLQQGRTAEGLTQLGNVMRQWQQVHEGMTHCLRLLNIDPQGLRVGEAAFADEVTELRNFLDQIREVVRARDTVLLADMLHYELEPLLTRWRRMLRCVQDQLQALPEN